MPTQRLASRIRNQLSDEFIAVRKDAVTTPSNFAEDLIVKKSPHLQIINNRCARQILTDIIRLSDDSSNLIKNISGGVTDLLTLFNELQSYQVDDLFFEQAKNPKISILFNIYKQYKQYLSDHNLLDQASLYGHASNLLEEEDLHIVVYGIRSPYPNLKQLFRKLGKTSASFSYYHPFDENPTIYTDKAEWLDVDQCSTVSPHESISFSHLFSQCEEPCNPKVPVYTHEFTSPKKEIEAVAQEIVSLLEQGNTCEDIVIGSPDLTTTTTQIYTVFPEFGLPFTSTATITLARSPLVQALLQLLEIPLNNYTREDIVAAFSSPYLELLPRSSSLTPANIDAILRQALIIDGYRTWSPSLTHLEKRTQIIIESPDTANYLKKNAKNDLAQIHDLQQQIIPFLTQVRNLEQTTTRSNHIAHIREFFSHLTVRSPGGLPHEGDDAKQLFALIDELEVQSQRFLGEELSYQDFIKSLKAEIRDTRTSRFKTGKGIKVVGLRELYNQTTPILFLLDLTEKNLPHIPGLLPFLSDDEEKLVNPEMKPMNLRDERFYFIAALCTATKRLYASTTNAPDKGGIIPSPFFRELKQKILCTEWQPEIPENSLRFRQEYAGICLGGQRIPPSNLLPGLGDLYQYNEVIDTINAENYHRKGIYDSPFDCVLCAEDAICRSLLKRFGDSRAYSISSLEKYADCPFSFYMQYVLGLKATPEVEITLTPSERGSLIHRILSEFYRRWMSERHHPPGPTDRSDAMALLTEITESEFLNFGKEGPAWDAFKSELLGTGGFHRGVLERFLDIEQDRAVSPLVPTYFECSFGFSGIGNCISVEPVCIPVKGEECPGIRIHGVIDRVDASEEGEFTITDYKTGRHASLSEVRKGTSLQLPIYIRSIEILTGKKGVAGAYYKLNRKEVYHKAEIHAPDHPLVKSTFTSKSKMGDENLDDLIDSSILGAWQSIQAIRSGIFHPPTEECSSDYCDYKRICRYNELRTINMEEPDGGEE